MRGGGVVAINLSIAVICAMVKVPKFSAQGLVAALIIFITKGEASLANSACCLVNSGAPIN